MTKQLAFELDKSPRDQAFEYAKDAYRVYVLRGDSMKWVMSTYMGGGNSEYQFATGGRLWTDSDDIVKIKRGKVGILIRSSVSVHIFSLKEIYDAVLKEAQP